jgi:Ni/Co efflux regulator RcnB
MKTFIVGVAAAAMTLVSTAASAQAYGGYYRNYGGYDQRYRDSDRDGRPDWREWNRDRDRDGRRDQYDRWDNRRGGAYGGYYNRRWRQGQVYPYYRNNGYVVRDYRAYNLPPPRPGYRYYRSDNGDVIMAAIASGVIGLIIGGALANNNRYDRGYYDHGYYGRGYYDRGYYGDGYYRRW